MKILYENELFLYNFFFIKKLIKNRFHCVFLYVYIEKKKLYKFYLKYFNEKMLLLLLMKIMIKKYFINNIE